MRQKKDFEVFIFEIKKTENKVVLYLEIFCSYKLK